MAQASVPQRLGKRPAPSFALAPAVVAPGALAVAGLALLVPQAWLTPAQAGPVVCTTTLEALAAGHPVDVTRCGAVVSTPQVVEQRFFTYTAPFAPGVDLTHQVTDLLGIALGGGGGGGGANGPGSGGKWMGFGFPDQTIVWDGTALQNTYQVLLEQQSDPLPWRTADVGNGFGASLAAGGTTQASGVGTAASAQAGAGNAAGASFRAPVRGLW